MHSKVHSMKLDKMKMPASKRKKPMMDEFSVMELESEGGEPDDGSDADATEFMGEAEGETGEEPESAEPEMGNPELESVSDDDLLAELQRRGLSAQLGK